jgi:ligand-binding sensor domain-containing protein
MRLMPGYKISILYITTVLILLTGKALTLASDVPTALNFEHITTKDGLANDHVLCINQDSKGFIWIGTTGGLQRYDGLRFKSFTYSLEDDNSISNNAVHAIYEDEKEKVLWIGTEGGLDTYDLQYETFTHYRHNPNENNSLSHNNVRSVIGIDDSILWIGTYGGGLNKFNTSTGEWKHYKNKKDDPKSICSDIINTIYVDNLNRMWIGTEKGGLSLFDRNSELFKNYTPHYGQKNTLTDAVVNSILLDNHGILWVCTWNSGVCSFNPEKEIFRNYPVDPGNPGEIRNSTVRAAIEDSRGNLWFATMGGGLTIYNREVDSFTSFSNSYKNPNSLSINFLWTLFEDRDGLIWTGTFGGGIDVLDSKRKDYQNFRFDAENPNSLSSNVVLTAMESRDGSIWIGTQGGGLNKFDRKSGKFTHYLENTDPKKALIRKIFEDSRGLIWIGSDKGLYQLNPKSGKTLYYIHEANKPKSLSNNSIFSIGEDNYGAIWVSIWNEGLNKIEPKEISKPNPDEAEFVLYKNDSTNNNSLSNNTVWAIYKDRSGILWICNEVCLEKFDQETDGFQHISYHNFNSIVEDTKGNLWLGSLWNGISKYDRKQGTVDRIKSGNSLNYNTVQCMVIDAQSAIWFATPNGIVKYNPSVKEFSTPDISVELQENEYNTNSMLGLLSGEILFGGKYGISIVDPNSIKQNYLLPKAEITGLYIFDEPVPIGPWKDKAVILEKSIAYTDKIKLSHKFFLLRFDFTALYFLSKNKIQYAYMLDGYDKNWNYILGYNPFAIYNKVAPGNYTFRVKTAIQNNNWSNERTLQIEITEPFYKTRWFKITIFLLLIALISVLYFHQLRNIKLREVRKYLSDRHEKENELNKMAQEKLDSELELKKKELASYTLSNIRKNEKLLKLKDELQLIMRVSLPKNKNRIEELIKEIENNMDNAGNWEYFENNFNMLHDDFLVRFASKYPKLTHKDLKICAFIRMNIDNKGIAKFLNITTESLGVSRTRIRKKINIEKDIFLNDFIMRF